MIEPNSVSEASSQVLKLKPRQGSFIFRRMLLGAVSSLILGAFAAAGIGLVGFNPALALFVVVALFAFNVYAAMVAYRKERYEIHGDRVLCHRGGVFGDETTELELRNVTHLKIMLPWLRHKLLGIGHVMVESAGSSKPIMMIALPDPKGAYEQLICRLRNNGFDLKQEELLHEERPAIAGVVLECLGLLGGAFFFGLFFLGLGLGLGVAMSEDAEPSWWLTLYDVFEVLFLLALVLFTVVRAFDLRRRSYRVFNDVVLYEEGFLTRNNALIPYENISDANTTRTLLDRILGMYDVKISCQGGGAEIKFSHLKRGNELSKAIDSLVSAASRKPKWKPAGVQRAAQRPSREDPEFKHEGPVVTGNYEMNGARLFVPALLLLPIFPVFVVLMIGLVIRKTCTKYSLRNDSLGFQFSFLNSNFREFAYNKITGVVVKRNLLDRMMGTMTLKFWSIGSSQAIEFQYIKQGDIHLPSLLAQLGVPPADGEPCALPIKFSLAVWMRAKLGLLVTMAVIGLIMSIAWIAMDVWPMHIVTALIVVVPIALDLIRSFLYFPRQQLMFYPHHVEAVQGILSISHYHACYRHIKRRKAICYPGSRAGSLEIFVAGEQMVGSSGSQQSDKRNGVVRQCSFTTGMLADAAEAGELLDDILCGRVNPAPGAVSAETMEGVMEAPRALKNAIIGCVLLCVILFPLLLILPLFLIWLSISIPKWRYRMDAARVLIERGVLYKTRETILLDRVDSLQQNQGPIHKLCGNGNVSIMTAGSSKPDLCIVDCPDYLNVYKMVRDHSQ